MCDWLKHALTAIVLSFLATAQANAEDKTTAEPCGTECLYCSALFDPASYAEGTMKSLHMVVPGTGSWLFRSDYDLSNQFGVPAQFQPDLKALVSVLASRGITLAFVVQPTRGLMHRDRVRADHQYGFDAAVARRNFEGFLRQLSAAGALVPDVSSLVNSPPQEEYFFRRDHHWTPAGARATARVAADSIRTHPIYQGLTRKAFATAPSIIIPKDGTMNTALRYLCGNNFGNQYVQSYETVPVADDASALFGEQAPTEVVIVGTSNSADRDDQRKSYNFAGFMREYLEVDILNYGLQGAGQDGSFIQYLHSADYNPEQPPKLIVWELPANYMLDDPLMYRQLIPALQGRCKADNTLIQHKSVLPAQIELPEEAKRARLEVLNNSGENRAQLNGFSGYVDLRISDKDLKEFYIITYYDNGSRDKVWVRRPNIVDGGQYFLSLSRDEQYTSANLLSVFVEPTEPTSEPASIEAFLCQ